MGPKNRKASTTAQKPAVPRNDKEQYHHIVPRFILRKFTIEDQDPNRSKKKPQQRKRGKNTAPVIYDPIYCYSASTSTLSINSVNTCYGETDIYKDVKNQEDVYEVEKKLSVLEGHASKAISGLHKLLESKDKEVEAGNAKPGPTVFRIQRKYLNLLRKFMFIMYYRNDGRKAIHFEDNHPENASSAPWIRNFRRKHNLDPSEMWLYVFKYFIDTPHSTLVEHGREAFEKIGPSAAESFSRGIDPNLEHAESIQYHGEAVNFFLTIWEAADGEEFVISNNAFGLVEGVTPPVGGGSMLACHRFYVISPRIALVLCAIPLRPDYPYIPEVDRLYRQSMLWGAPHKAPSVTKNGERAQRAIRVETFEEDTMEYELSKLSVEHTHKVNAIILGNIRSNGTLSFRTPSAMLKTLEGFSKDRDFNNQEVYRPLFTELLKITGGSSEYSPIPNPFPTSTTNPYVPLSEEKQGFYNLTFIMYKSIKQGDATARQPFTTLENNIIKRATKVFGQTPYDINPRPARLREHMENRHAVVMFKALTGFMEYFLNDKLPEFFSEGFIFAFLEWLLENRRLMFQIIEKRLPVYLMEWVIDEPEEIK